MAEESKKIGFWDRLSETQKGLLASAFLLVNCAGVAAVARHGAAQQEKESLATYPAAHRDLDKKLNEENLVRIPAPDTTLAFTHKSACKETSTGVVVYAERQGDIARPGKYLACIEKPGDTVSLVKMHAPAR